MRTRGLLKDLSIYISRLMYSEEKHNAQYRPDVDGLRAVAVLAVVLFHAFPKHLAGGFVGVDVFFVISGFLITGIIHRNLKSERFNFGDFWARRVRRIFPALLTVILATFAAGWFYLLPAEFETLKSHIKWGLAFLANIKLNNEVGYFDTAAELKPLLHLWSLAIEEQFYLVWPVVLWLSFRKKLNLFTLTMVLAVLSYQSRKYFSQSASDIFYFPWTRFWELQVGALLALWHDQYATRVSPVLEKAERFVRPLLMRDSHTSAAGVFKGTLSVTGLAMIVYSCVAFSKATPFPSKYTLFPVVGAALIIFSGANAWLNRRFLSLRVMRFVGLISFPLYLWHWPILSFARIILGEPSARVAWVCIALSFLLSIATYYTIEKFMRFEISRWRWRAPALTAALCGIVVFLKFGGINPRADSFRIAKINAAINGGMGFPLPSWRKRDDWIYDAKTNVKQTTLFVGDSYLHQYAPRIEKLSQDYPDQTQSAVFFDFQCCFVPTGQSACSNERTLSCKKLKSRFDDYVGALPTEVTTIVYANNWPAYSSSPSFTEDTREFLKLLKGTGRELFVVLPHPFANGRNGELFAPASMVKRSIKGFSIEAHGVERAKAKIAQKDTIDFILGLKRDISFKIIDPFDSMCSEIHCPALDPEGYPISREGSHTSPFGIAHMGSFIDEVVRPPVALSKPARGKLSRN